MVRRARGFTAWYAATLLTLVGGIELLRVVHEAPVPPPPVQVETAVLAVPPKPQTAQEPGSGTTREYSWERCATLPGDFRDTCFAALARQRAERDPDGALEACAEVAEGPLRDECTADVAEGHARVDIDRSHAICATIPTRKWRDQCTFGIAMAWARHDPPLALQTCEAAGMWRPFCRHDVNGERAVVDPDGAVAYCEALPHASDHLAKHACWHGIGKYIGRVDVAKALRVCRQAPTSDESQGQCVHGAAWAAAESEGDAALSWCTQTDTDSCVMGVAYHAKRFDPDRALELCARVQHRSERERCEEFVQRSPATPPTALP